MRIGIIDYGMGNIHSLSSALKYLSHDDIIVSNDIKELKNSDYFILPGVGSFALAMENILKLELDKILNELVIEKKKPILGICLGMQLLGTSSTENGFNKGLQFIQGEVKRFEDLGIKIPHVGFNQVEIVKDTRLYRSLQNNTDFYFTHSYKMMSEANINQSTCNYNSEFIASYEFENVAGVQFHPELSQKNGLQTHYILAYI